MKVLVKVLVVLLATLCYATKNDTAFVATGEWQEIGEGQAIPQGLHVRINLQTGKKEAKLLEQESNDTSRSTLSTVPGENVQDHDVGNAERIANMEKLKEALQRIPTDDFKFDEEELKKVKAKYKSYEEIRQELKDAQLDVKTDSDIMADLFEHFNEIRQAGQLADATIKTELDAIFEDLQYLVHQIDNAVDFINRQGIEQVIWPALNQTESSTLKVHGFKLLGTVVQNNPKAKVALFERNGGGILLTKLSQSTDTLEVSAGLYALGSLLRKFPFAQTELLNPHGYSLLFDVFNKKVDLRVKFKVVKLISDLVQDYDHALTTAEVDPLTKEQYQSTNLKEGLLKTDYCNVVREFFRQNKVGFAQDENLTEEVVEALRSVSTGLCADTWSRCALFRHTLLVLRNTLDTRLGELGQDGKGGDYLREVLGSVVRFLEELYGKPKESRDEL